MRKGFSLIEVLVSILILGVFMASFGVGLSHILIADEIEKAESRAINFAEKKLEEYRTAVLSNWYTSFPLSGNFSSEGWTSYIYSLSVNSLNLGDLRQVKVMVWNDENNNNTCDNFESKSILITIISRRK
ncbi:MAG TPA: type II secretion system protein [Dictyoglomaceae bacterium]|nr:type II secretion system protein [Dictyoglomaceae bacterium]HOP95445.1 type II secretion system protein [Dictyoglomaceae bacterium]HPP15600.1 type II secretion system protein [Dictyoglomaceae bacterium]HPU42916.1 type II secretion system protein [Dictyoglomaceae bacterium]